MGENDWGWGRTPFSKCKKKKGPVGSGYNLNVPFSRQSLQRSGELTREQNKNPTTNHKKAPATDRCSVSWGSQKNPAPGKGRAMGGFGLSQSHSLGGNHCPRGRGFLELSRFPHPVEKSPRIGFHGSARQGGPSAETSSRALPTQTQHPRDPLQGGRSLARLPGNRLPCLLSREASTVTRAARCMAGPRGVPLFGVRPDWESGDELLRPRLEYDGASWARAAWAGRLLGPRPVHSLEVRPQVSPFHELRLAGPRAAPRLASRPATSASHPVEVVDAQRCVPGSAGHVIMQRQFGA